MHLKDLCLKFAIFSLRHIFLQKKLRAFIIWRSLPNRKSMTSRSRIPTYFTVNISPKIPAQSYIKASETKLKRPTSVKSESHYESPVDFGSRLHQKAKEIEKKKENTRKSLEPEYSFTPKLSNGTPKWLNSRSQKEIKVKNEDVAVVSGNNIIQFTNYNSGLKGLIESKVFAQGNCLGINRKNDKIIPNRKIDRIIKHNVGFSQDMPKENLHFIDL